MNIIPIREENQVILSKIEIERKKERKENKQTKQYIPCICAEGKDDDDANDEDDDESGSLTLMVVITIS